MDELKTHECWVYDYGCRVDMVSKTDVDAAIAEKDAEIRRLKRALWLAMAERAKDRAITCDGFAYLGDTERNISMTLARTWMKCRLLKPSKWSKVWKNVARKCRAKAEEYK